MTEKIRQSQIMIPSIEFSEEQWRSFEHSGRISLSAESRILISNTVEDFVTCHIDHLSSVPPRNVEKILSKVISSLDRSIYDIGQLLQFPDEDDAIMEKISHSGEIEPEKNLLRVLSGLKELSANHRGIDPVSIYSLDATKSIIETSFNEIFNGDGEEVIYITYHSLKRIKEASEKALTKIKTGTGAPENDYLHEFLIRLSDIFHGICHEGRNSDRCISYMLSICNAVVDEYRPFENLYPLRLRALSKEAIIEKMKYKSKKIKALCNCHPTILQNTTKIFTDCLMHTQCILTRTIGVSQYF